VAGFSPLRGDIFGKEVLRTDRDFQSFGTMPPGNKEPNDARPKSYIALSPATVGVICLVAVAVAAAFRFLPDTKAPEAPPAPAYPDLRPRVNELEQQLAAAKSAPPAWPNLSDKVAALESTLAVLQGQLAVAQAAPEYSVLRNRLAALESELTATRDALAAAKKGEVEAQLRIERDDLAGRTDRLTREVTQLRGDRERMQRLLAVTGQQMRRTSAEKTAPSGHEAALAAMVDELQTTRSALATAREEASQANEALATLQRTTNRALAEAAANRTQLDQVRGTNMSLTQENQRLKSSPAPGGVAPTPPAFATPTGPILHVVAAGDSLSNLSARYYGTPARWPDIYQVNADLLGPTGTLRIGTTLRIP